MYHQYFTEFVIFFFFKKCTFRSLSLGAEKPLFCCFWNNQIDNNFPYLQNCACKVESKKLWWFNLVTCVSNRVAQMTCQT